MQPNNFEALIWGKHNQLFATQESCYNSITKEVLAGACGNRTHPARFWQATLDLKSRRDTRTLCTPVLDIKGFFRDKATLFLQG